MSPESQDHHSGKCLCTTTNKLGGRHGQRRLVVAFDGTQNQFGPESSHVVEFYSRIVKSGDQLSYYSSGVGTFVKPSSSMRHMRMWTKNKWAAAVALNFKSNLLSGYRFLSDKYEMGDQIFLLGFSRGAYQARVLAAMITKVGLLRTGNNEQIPFAFNIYKDPEASKETPIDSDHSDERGTTTTAKEFRKAFCHDVNIHFVGVWDTVSSVGLFRNKYYPGAESAENICFFRHALALDERRVKFLPEYIVAKKENFSADEFGRPRCKEVWFRGSHSDIGGGNVKNKTSDNGAIPSRWMAYEAMIAGLEMTPFWGGIKVKDLEPKTGKDSMTRLYTPLEYFLINWEDHSEERPPLLTSEGEPPERRFSPTWHRKRPRQIFDYQKLHSSVCLHSDLSEEPFAYLPDSWINKPEKRYSWTEVIKLLRIEVDAKDKAASESGTIASLPPELSSMPAPSPPHLQVVPQAIQAIPSETTNALRNTVRQVPAVTLAVTVNGNVPAEFELPAGAIELDLLDCNGIPALIAGVLRGTNVDEFLERLKVLAYTDIGRTTIQQNNKQQFTLMLQRVCGDKKYAEYTWLAIRVAYEVFWLSAEVDLYDSEKELWKAIFSRVKKWNESQAPSSSLQRAVRLLHQTKSENAFVEIEKAILKMFDSWKRSQPSAPLQLRILLSTAVDCTSRHSILRLAVFSSPRFSDAEFTKILLKRLINTINSTVGETRKLAMLYFCVLCAIDEEVILDEELFGPLQTKFVELGTPMKEMWELVMPETSDTLHGFGGKPETMTKLKKFLQRRITEALGENDRSWARNALDKALNPQQNRPHLSFATHRNRVLPAERSKEEPSDGEFEDVFYPANRSGSLRSSSAPEFTV